MGRHQPAERPEHRQSVLPAALHRAAGAHDRLAVRRMSERDAHEDALRVTAHDAFMAFWPGAESDRAALWTDYCEAQDRYDAYLLQRS